MKAILHFTEGRWSFTIPSAGLSHRISKQEAVRHLESVGEIEIDLASVLETETAPQPEPQEETP